MLKFQKIHRFFQSVRVLLEKYSRKGSLYILSGVRVEYEPLFPEILTQRIGRLKRKGYTVQVQIWMLKKVFEKHSQESQISLMLQGVQVV